MSNKIKKEKNNSKQELSINIKKSEDLSKWYTEVITKADLIEYTDVSGCNIFKPNSYQIWEKIQNYLDNKIKKRGVKNAYFPLFIPEHLLVKESDHIEGFTPEVAWVTKAGENELKEKLAVRPTSETIMYDAYSKWIRSYRDLPLKLNQWCNVVRWEFKHPTPFMRNREFLWQEGHTAFATKEEAEKEVLEALEDYRSVYEDLLALYVIKGRKSIAEKFAGADYSTTIELIAPDGKSIQGCTSHHLGTHFSKAFNITYLDKNQKKQLVYQNSWGLSTRTIAALILLHGDDKGLVLPPRVATNKVVIVPLFFKGKEEIVLEKAKELKEILGSEINSIIDDRKEYSPGFKYNEWELKGIPIRIEIGPRDIENKQFLLVRRDTGEKIIIPESEIRKEKIEEILEEIHTNLYERSKKLQEEMTTEASNIEEFEKAIKEKKRVLVPWYENEKMEDEIKEKYGVKTSCIPFKYQERNLKGVKCFYSGKPANCYAFFAKSY
jgi:prolyl-tRNA synthetase